MSTSPSPTQMEAARTPLTDDGRASSRPWARFVGPLVAAGAIAALAAGLLLLLNEKGQWSWGGPKLGATTMQCGMYQDPSDPTVQLTDAEIWADPGKSVGGWAGGCWGCRSGGQEAIER